MCNYSGEIPLISICHPATIRNDPKNRLGCWRSIKKIVWKNGGCKFYFYTLDSLVDIKKCIGEPKNVFYIGNGGIKGLTRVLRKDLEILTHTP